MLSKVKVKRAPILKEREKPQFSYEDFKIPSQRDFDYASYGRVRIFLSFLIAKHFILFRIGVNIVELDSLVILQRVLGVLEHSAQFTILLGIKRKSLI